MSEGARRWPADVPAQLVEIMERVCTDAELDALELKARGYGTRPMANLLGISRRALRDRLQSAERKIRQEVAAMRGVS